jgi:hypothetical protein
MRITPEFEVPLGNVAKVILGCDKKDFDKSQLAIGTAVELEHTEDPKKAEQIACDHLAENPDYYTDPMKRDWGADEAKERIEDLAKTAAKHPLKKPFHQIREEEAAKGNKHIHLTCSQCGESHNCRCTSPDKPRLLGICPECEEKNAKVFVLEDDLGRIASFRTAFGPDNVVTTKNVKEALELLRTKKFAKVFLDRDLSSATETGEDVAWQMEKENLCIETPVVIHSENTRGQKVMARYLNRYHPHVSVVPFRELKKQLDVPGGVRI